MTRNQLLQRFVQDRGHYLGFLLTLSRNPDWAEELFQDLSLQVIEHLESFDPERDFGAWVRGIARNLYRKSAAGRARRKAAFGPLSPRLEEALALAHAERTPQEEEERRELFGRLHACLGRVGEKQRELFLRRFRESATTAELAARFQMSAEALHTAVCRIRAALLRCLSREREAAP